MSDKYFDWLWGNAGVTVSMLLFTLGAAAGWTVNGWRADAEIERIRRDYANESRRQKEALAGALQTNLELERQGAAISLRVLEAEERQRKTAREKDDAIKKLTAGRPCLPGAVVRLLNGPADLSAGSGLRLPEAAAGAASSLAGAAADPGGQDYAADTYATDSGVALWARDARDRYDACRARIDALRDFHAHAN